MGWRSGEMGKRIRQYKSDCIALHNEQNVKVCDATGDAMKRLAGIKNYSLINSLFNAATPFVAIALSESLAFSKRINLMPVSLK